MSELQSDEDNESIAETSPEEIDPVLKLGHQGSSENSNTGTTENDQEEVKESSKEVRLRDNVDIGRRPNVRNEQQPAPRTRSRSRTRISSKKSHAELDEGPISQASVGGKNRQHRTVLDSPEPSTDVRSSDSSEARRESDTEDHSNHFERTGTLNSANGSSTEGTKYGDTEPQYVRKSRQIAERQEKDDENINYNCHNFTAIIIVLLLIILFAVLITWPAEVEKPKLLSSIAKLYPIHNTEEVFRLLRGLKSSYLIGDELLVLTFAGYLPQNLPEKRRRQQLKFRKFKIDVMKSFLNNSIEKELRAVFAESRMNSVELENEIERIRRKSCPKLIWIEDVLSLKNESLQLLRKYTDKTNLDAETNTLVVLSFDLYEEDSGYSADPTDVMRRAFKTEMIFDEIEPFLARVAENVIEYKPVEINEAEL